MSFTPFAILKSCVPAKFFPVLEREAPSSNKKVLTLLHCQIYILKVKGPMATLDFQPPPISLLPPISFDFPPPAPDSLSQDETTNSSNPSKAIYTVIGILIMVSSISSFMYKMYRKADVEHHPDSGSSSNVPKVPIPGPAIPNNEELVHQQIYTNLTLDQIVCIKSYCRESYQIGEGSFARVYRGIFQGKDLAIKEIEHKSPDTKTWVENEVELLQGKEDININSLYAWCIQEKISYLAYMYIDGCTLDDYLTGNCKGYKYSWKQSFRMIMGIAKGIEFLHLNKIIHVDIKPENIMVDSTDNEAKLVDFGFSRHVDWEGTHRSTDKIIGTKGYWAPEYCWNNQLSYKHDVYSFGIVVLRMITGQRHVDQDRSSSQFHIPGYVRHMIENNRFEEAVDPKLKQDGWDIFALEEAFAVANIALRCAHPDKAGRPDMGLVLTELTSTVTSAHNHINLRQEEAEIEIVTSR